MCADQLTLCSAMTPTYGVTLGVFVQMIKQPDGSWRFNGATCQPTGPPQVSAAMVREQAVRLIPTAAVGVAPRTSTLVNIQTIMWVGAPETRTLAPVTILGQRVTIAITLDHVAWDYGDGDADTTTDPGKAYDSAGDPCATPMCADYFGHVYARTGAMTVAATVSWTATFRVGNGPVVPIPGTIDGPAGQSTVRVLQARGVLVPDPRGR